MLYEASRNGAEVCDVTRAACTIDIKRRFLMFLFLQLFMFLAFFFIFSTFFHFRKKTVTKNFSNCLRSIFETAETKSGGSSLS